MTARPEALPDPPYEADKKEHLGRHRLGCGTLLPGTNLRCFMFQVVPGILVAAVFIGGSAAECTPQPWMAATVHVQCAPPCHSLMRADTPDALLELRTGHMTAWRGALADPAYEADKRVHLGRRRLGCSTLLRSTNLQCFVYQVMASQVPQMDRCWSVAGTSCVAAFFTVVMMTNSGFMYLSFLEEFDVNRESASWPASVLSIVGHLAGILVSLGQGHVSVFQMGIVGSVFLWAGLLGATFAPNMTWMTLTVGLIHGTGVGVVCLTLIVLVMMYFDKYRGIASGMKFAGYSLSSLLYPVILTSLKDAYGFRGALLICAALTMNVTALSLLLKEPPWWTCKRKRWHSSTTPVTEKRPSSNSLAVKWKPREFDQLSLQNLHDSMTLPSIPVSMQVNKLEDLHSSRMDIATARASASNNERLAVLVATALQSETEESRTTVSLQTSNSVLRNESTAHLFPKYPNTCAEKTADYNAVELHTARLKEKWHLESSTSFTMLQQMMQLLAKPRFYAVVLAVVAIDYTVAVFPATIVDYALDKGSARRHADLSVSYCAPAEITDA
ncbi:uncharacterized protein LOC142804169 [Rhipicephalus microplus]|uniref:uncharacterized protein LOC142804169 n=1 Tax=Rhipicephalus microplus TaxID=6941 RepID=UPI003F6AB805